MQKTTSNQYIALTDWSVRGLRTFRHS